MEALSNDIDSWLGGGHAGIFIFTGKRYTRCRLASKVDSSTLPLSYFSSSPFSSRIWPNFAPPPPSRLATAMAWLNKPTSGSHHICNVSFSSLYVSLFSSLSLSFRVTRSLSPHHFPVSTWDLTAPLLHLRFSGRDCFARAFFLLSKTETAIWTHIQIHELSRGITRVKS